MSNMNYCRFNNTKLDVDDCIEALENDTQLSSAELEKAKDMFHNILTFCCNNGMIDDYNQDQVDEYLNQFAK